MRKLSFIGIGSFYLIVVVLFLCGTVLGNRAVTAIAELKPIERTHRIVIDAGHGGEDGGAISCTGKTESGFNLSISKKVNDVFQLLGYKTQMIRTEDTAVYTHGDTIAQKKSSDLKERVRITNLQMNSLLISIHQNQFSEAQYYGAQVFYGQFQGSKELAENLQTTLVSSLNPGSNRKTKKGDGIFLLEHANCCSVLVECGFLSNPAEEKKLSDIVYQQKLAQVICTTVASYLEKA